jgi:peptide/nickel transport system substrate-binding protein
MSRKTKHICLLMAVLMVVSLFSACSNPTATGNSDEAKTSDGGSSEGAGAAHDKDMLRIALTSEPPSLGLYDHSSLISVLMNQLTFNGLIRIDNETLEPVCDLAESYTVENDTDWTFVLKKGVKFHNGEEMTADDVVASLSYAKSLPATTLYTNSFKTIEAVDKYTVKLITHEPYAGLLYDLAYYYNFIVPKSLIESNNDFNANPIGTGPYRLVEWNFGNTITYEAFEEYFDKDHVAKINNLVFSIIPEGASRSMAIEAGEIDFVWEVSGADVERLKSNSGVKVEEIDSVDNVILFFNNDIEPWKAANLRNAIAAAINREDIIAAALNGYGKPNYSCIASGHVGSSDKDAIPYNLDKAKEYLKLWGGDPSSVTLSILCSNETRVAIGTVIQSCLKELGIKVDVVSMDTASYMQRWKVGDFDSVIASWSPSNALSYIQRFHSDRRKTYAGGINDPEIDAKVLKAQATLDESERLAIMEDIISSINKLSTQVSLYQSQWFRAHNADLAGVVCSKTGYASFNDMYWAK